MIVIVKAKETEILNIAYDRWHGEYRNCSNMFTSSKTDDGFCCSFNTVSLAEGPK